MADLGTKNLVHEESAYKLSLLEMPVTDYTIGQQSKRGDETANATNDRTSPEHATRLTSLCHSLIEHCQSLSPQVELI